MSIALGIAQSVNVDGLRVSKTVNGSTTGYGYDGSGNQVSRTSNGTTTTNLWDTTSGMAQLVDDGSTSYVQANGAQEAIDSGEHHQLSPDRRPRLGARRHR